MAEHDDIGKLYEAFEEALIDVLMEDDSSLGLRTNFAQVRRRLHAHKDVTTKGYEDAVLRAARRAWALTTLERLRRRSGAPQGS
jgi:hypothetical protein